MGTTRARFTDLGDAPLADDDLIGSHADGIASHKFDVPDGQEIVRGQVMKIDWSAGTAVAAATAAEANGIAAEDCNTTDSPVEVQQVNVYIQGSFNEHALTLGSIAVEDLRPYFRGLGLILETPVKRYPDA